MHTIFKISESLGLDDKNYILRICLSFRKTTKHILYDYDEQTTWRQTSSLPKLFSPNNANEKKKIKQKIFKLRKKGGGLAL